MAVHLILDIKHAYAIDVCIELRWTAEFHHYFNSFQYDSVSV